MIASSINPIIEELIMSLEAYDRISIVRLASAASTPHPEVYRSLGSLSHCVKYCTVGFRYNILRIWVSRINNVPIDLNSK